MKDVEYEVIPFNPHEKFHAHYLIEPHRSFAMMEVHDAARELGLNADRVASLVFRAVEVEDELPGIVLSTLRRASEQLSPGVALDVLEREQIRPMQSHAIVSDVLSSPEIPLYTLDELADLVGAFADHLERNRDHLLATGFPRTSFAGSLWLHLRLSWLYPIKTPEEIGTRPTESGDLEYVFGWSAKRVSPRRIALLPYETAPLRDGMSLRAAARIDRIRPRLLELKVRLIRRLADALRERRDDSTALCLGELARSLTYREVEFLLSQDANLRNFGPLTDFIVGAKRPTNPPYSVSGGISGILDILYHCEREIGAGPMDQTKREVVELARRCGANESGSVLGSPAYYRAITQPWRGELEGLLQRYMERYRAAWRAHPWDAFAKRVDEYLEGELEHTVRVRTRASKEHAAKLKGKIPGLLRVLKGSLEATGSLPEISVQVSATGEPEAGNAFRREGQFWTVRYQGKSVSLANSRGLQLVAALLGSPHKAIPVLELRATVTGEEAFRHPSTAGPRLSYQTRQECEERLAELSGLIDTASAQGEEDRLAELLDEKNAIERELRAGFGLGARPRMDADDAARARQAVQAAISRTLKILDREHHDLWVHLKNSLRLGAHCAYVPDSDPRWSF